MYVQSTKSHSGLQSKNSENIGQEVHMDFRSFKNALEMAAFSCLRIKSKQLHIIFSGGNLKDIYSVIFQSKYKAIRLKCFGQNGCV